MQLSFFINFALSYLQFIASYLLCNSGLSNVWPAMSLMWPTLKSKLIGN